MIEFWIQKTEDYPEVFEEVILMPFANLYLCERIFTIYHSQELLGIKTLYES